jgi:activating signal cointegrator 1
VKALSLWQPWATLMAVDLKRNETRSWYTPYRGLLAIHAAKFWNSDLHSMCLGHPFRVSLESKWAGFDERARYCGLPAGAFVCVVRLLDCVQITAANAPAGVERAFGDYTPGRYMWRTQLVRTLDLPLPYRGAQGIFDVPPGLLSAPQGGVAGAAPLRSDTLFGGKH